MAKVKSSSFISIGGSAQISHLSRHRALHLVVTWMRANLISPEFFTKREAALAKVVSCKIPFPQNRSGPYLCLAVKTGRDKGMVPSLCPPDDLSPLI
jgi:hypothetical protein